MITAGPAAPVGPAVGVGLTLVIFAVQGPGEWVWTSLTYGRLQPFRITSARVG